MSLRKSPRLTPELLAANRRNARLSTGPRTPAAKQNSKLNALKHGRYAALENHYQTMLALGEDLEEFESLKQELMTAFGPGDALWKKQLEDLARLYWRRVRLEKAPVERGACLAIIGKAWRMMLGQEVALDRSIDPKVRVLVRLRKEFPGGNLRAGAHNQGSDADMENIGKTVEIDIPSGTPATEQA